MVFSPSLIISIGQEASHKKDVGVVRPGAHPRGPTEVKTLDYLDMITSVISLMTFVQCKYDEFYLNISIICL